jgi:hypothetical protein
MQKHGYSLRLLTAAYLAETTVRARTARGTWAFAAGSTCPIGRRPRHNCGRPLLPLQRRPTRCGYVRIARRGGASARC